MNILFIFLIETNENNWGVSDCYNYCVPLLNQLMMYQYVLEKVGQVYICFECDNELKILCMENFSSLFHFKGL